MNIGFLDEGTRGNRPLFLSWEGRLIRHSGWVCELISGVRVRTTFKIFLAKQVRTDDGEQVVGCGDVRWKYIGVVARKGGREGGEKLDRSNVSSFLSVVLAVLALLALGLVPKTVGSADGEEAIRSAQRLAAQLAASASIENLGKQQLKGQAERWTAVILSDLHGHQQTAKSKALLEVEFEADLRAAVDRSLSRIQESFNSAEEEGKWFSLDWLKEYVRLRLGKALEKGIKENRREYFEDTFKSSRMRATKEQLQSIPIHAPHYKNQINDLMEFVVVNDEIRLRWGNLKENELQKRLEVSVASGAMLLEETKIELKVEIGEMLNNARTQAEMQILATKEPISQSLVTKESIYQVLLSKVQRTVNSLKETESDSAYVHPIFSGLREAASSLAEREERSRFLSFLREFKFETSPAEIRAFLLEDLRGHAEKGRSMILVRDWMFSRALLNVLGRYASRLEDGSDPGIFVAHLRDLATKQPTVHNAFEKRLEKFLGPALEQVRRQISEEQLEAAYPIATSGEWIVSEKLLMDVSHGRESLKSFADFETAMSNNSALRKLISKGGDGSSYDSLLREAREGLWNRVQSYLAEGECAVQKQKQIIDRLNIDIPKRIGTDDDKKTRQEWKGFFKGEARQDWKKVIDENGCPPVDVVRKFGDRYGSLFEFTTFEIEKIVDAQFTGEKVDIKKGEVELEKRTPFGGSQISSKPARPTQREDSRDFDVVSKNAESKIPEFVIWLGLILVLAVAIAILLALRRARGKGRRSGSDGGDKESGGGSAQKREGGGLSEGKEDEEGEAPRWFRWIVRMLIILILIGILLIVLWILSSLLGIPLPFGMAGNKEC